MGETLDTLRRLLQETKLEQITDTKQKVVVLEHNFTVECGLQELARNKILSAPLVISPSLEDLGSGYPEPAPSLVGWVDIVDILNAFLRHLHEQLAGEELPTSVPALMSFLEAEAPAFMEKMLITVMGGHDRGLLYQPDAASSIMSVVQEQFLAATDKNDGSPLRHCAVHRVATFNADGSVTSVVSHLDVLAFLLKSLPEEQEGAAPSLKELGLLDDRPKVVSVDPHAPTLLALERMLGSHIMGVPVIASSGELIANLSISDLRCIEPEHFGILALPVAEFLALAHDAVYVGYSAAGSTSGAHPFFATSSEAKRKAPQASQKLPEAAGKRAEAADEKGVPLVTIPPSAGLRELLAAFVDNRVHRAYVAEEAPGPKGSKLRATAVLTPTDVLRLVAGQSTA